MLKEVFESAATLAISLKEMLSGFSLRKYLFWFIIIYFSTLPFIITYEFYSGHFYFNRIEKKIDALNKISPFAQNSLELKESLKTEYLAVVKEIAGYDHTQIISLPLPAITNYSFIFETIIKILSGFLIPFFVLIYSKKTDPQNNSIFTGSLIIGLLSSIVAYFIPIIGSVWINFLIIPLIQLLIVVPLGLRKK